MLLAKILIFAVALISVVSLNSCNKDGDGSGDGNAGMVVTTMVRLN